METQAIGPDTIMVQRQMILELQVGLQTRRVQRNFWCEIQPCPATQKLIFS
jgi:hypothetical protein